MSYRTIIFLSMSAMFAVGTLLAAEPFQHRHERPDAPHRSLSALRLDVQAALCAEAVTRRQGQNSPEVLRLIDLFHEMAAHPNRDTNALLEQLGVKVRTRLQKVRDHIERQSAHPKHRANRAAVPPASVVPESLVLAQQIANPAGGPGGQNAQPAATQPAAVRSIDYGPELVELIQHTISPATWDINGGKGAIVYFAPLRVIVVSAPGTVHAHIGDVLGQLRAAP